MKKSLFAVILLFASCKDKSVVIENQDYQYTEIEGVFPNSFTTAELDALDNVERMVFEDFELAVLTDIFPRSYGHSFVVRVYNKLEWLGGSDELAEVPPWQQCLMFSAKSYDSLRFDLDEENDELLIFGTRPDGKEELTLRRVGFSDGLQMCTGRRRLESDKKGEQE